MNEGIPLPVIVYVTDVILHFIAITYLLPPHYAFSEEICLYFSF